MVGQAEQNIHAELPGAGSMLPTPWVLPATWQPLQPVQGFIPCFLSTLRLCQPPRTKGTVFSQGRAFHFLSSGVKIG